MIRKCKIGCEKVHAKKHTEEFDHTLTQSIVYLRISKIVSYLAEKLGCTEQVMAPKIISRVLLSNLPFILLS